MRSLKSLGKSGAKAVKKGVKDVGKAQLKILGGGVPEGINKTVDTLIPDINIPGPEKEAVMPIPDEELGRAARRRMRARRKGGRSSSILTGGDSIGGY